MAARSWKFESSPGHHPAFPPDRGSGIDAVELADAETDEEKTYQIVGDLEADIKMGLIAISSPVARALIGKHEGDTITIEAPGGTREYEIVGVSYQA